MESLLEQGYEIAEKPLFKSYQVYLMIMLSKGYSLLPKKIRYIKLLRFYQRMNIIGIHGLSILGWYDTFNDLKGVVNIILAFVITILVYIWAWLFTVSVPVWLIWAISLA